MHTFVEAQSGVQGAGIDGLTLEHQKFLWEVTVH